MRSREKIAKGWAGCRKKTPGRSSDAQVGDAPQLEALARLRADQVKAYLIRSGHVAPERIQLNPARVKSTPDGETCRVELFLSAH